MTNSIRAELLRLRKWPVVWIVSGVWLVLNLTFGYLFDYLSYRDAVSSGDQGLARALLAQLSLEGVPATMTTGLPIFGGALVLTLAALTTGSGYGWNTWKTVFTQGPSRLAVLGGTLTALAVVVAGVVVAALIADVAASAIVMTVASQPLTWPDIGALAEGLGGALLIVGMWAAAGAFLGVIAKGPALAVGLGLVWSLVVENLLRGVAGILGPLESVPDFLPGTAAGSLAGAIGAATASEAGGAPGVLTVLTGTASVALLAAYIAAFVVLAAIVVSRRDA